MTEKDVWVSVYKSEDGDYDIYVRDPKSPDINPMLTLRVDADKLNLLAALFRFIQDQPEGALVAVDAEAHDVV